MEEAKSSYKSTKVSIEKAGSSMAKLKASIFSRNKTRERKPSQTAPLPEEVEVPGFGGGRDNLSGDANAAFKTTYV